MYACLTDMFHHCREKNNNMSTTKTKKKKKRERTTNKIGNTKRTKKYVHQPKERYRESEKEKEKIELLYCLKVNM